MISGLRLSRVIVCDQLGESILSLGDVSVAGDLNVMFAIEGAQELRLLRTLQLVDNEGAALEGASLRAFASLQTNAGYREMGHNCALARLLPDLVAGVDVPFVLLHGGGRRDFIVSG